MPEKVYTRFSDDDEPQKGVPKALKRQNEPATLAPSKKRKRNENEKAPSQNQNGATETTILASRLASKLANQNYESIPKSNGAKPTSNGNKPPNTKPQNNRLSGKPGFNAVSQQTQSQLAKRRDALLPFRKALPIYPHADTIRSALRTKDTLILTGETGSGKSTQVPQFLLSEPWCTKCIAITQPRRVAAISLARRVAEEMGSLLGSQSPASKVGYSVRFDNSTGPGTRVKFLTEGMLLQEMLRDPELKAYSTVVVDEVHERSVNVDLILGFLKGLVGKEGRGKRREALKVVVMSATADVEGLVRFFDEGEGKEGGEEKKVEENGVNGGAGEQPEPAMTGKKGKKKKGKHGRKPEIDQDTVAKIEKASTTDKTEPNASTVSTCFVEGRQFPVKTIYLPEPTQDFVESALKAIFQIHYKEPLPGDILVFLTGQDTVEALERLVNEYALGMDKDVPKVSSPNTISLISLAIHTHIPHQILALPLFAALPQHAQQLIFHPAPPKTRKIILATNIAETSVTVPGVRFVIDSGKVKIKHFRNRLGLDSLLVKPISQSAAIQRKGRAGREAPGQCYRLYTEKDYEALPLRTTPEILRCDLSAAILTMKARGIDDVINFPFLDRPPRESLEKALLQLLQLGALTETGAISDIGRKIAKLPLTPSLGRVLVEAAKPERDCLVDVIDIIACLSVENIFLNIVTEEKKEEAEEARRELFRREGDHLTLLVAVQRYAEENSDRRAWCERRFISHRAMQNVMVSFDFSVGI